MNNGGMQIYAEMRTQHHLIQEKIGKLGGKGSLVRARKGAMRSRRSGKWREWLIKP